MAEEVFFHFPEKFYVDLIFEDCLSRSLVSMEIASLSLVLDGFMKPRWRL